MRRTFVFSKLKQTALHLRYTKEALEQIRQLIADGESQRAIEALFAIASEDERVEDELVLVDSRLAHLQKSILEGTIARDDEIIERNIINRSMLALLKILEQEPTARKPPTKKAPAPPAENPQPESAAPAPEKTFRVTTRQLWVTGALALLMLSTWGIGKWLFTPRAAPEIRNLTARIVLRPGQPPFPDGAEARLLVGNHLSILKPVPENGVIHFENTPIRHPEDSARLQLSGLNFPGKIAEQSAPNFERTDSITFYYNLELIELKGRIVDYARLKPVAGIEIILENGLAQAVTGKDGRYSLNLPRLKKDRVDVELRRNGKVIDKLTMGFIPELFEELKVRN